MEEETKNREARAWGRGTHLAVLGPPSAWNPSEVGDPWGQQEEATTNQSRTVGSGQG